MWTKERREGVRRIERLLTTQKGGQPGWQIGNSKPFLGNEDARFDELPLSFFVASLSLCITALAFGYSTSVFGRFSVSVEKLVVSRLVLEGNLEA